MEGLSAQTLQALKEFALSSGVALDEDNLLGSVKKHFEVEREEIFNIEYSSKDNARNVKFVVKGVKRELGQTLNSTGLTIWRAAEHLCQYIMDNPNRFAGKSVCELGAGLGLVSILLDKLEICKNLVVTDGDEDTMQLLVENKVDTDCSFDTSFLYWGEHEDFLSEHPEKFDLLIAADVIYEIEQVRPLIETVSAIMKEGTGEFILAFARRNVPIDKVFEVAIEKGLQYQEIDSSVEGISMEPIYSFTWKQ